ncbi:MAG: adenylate/guanylate cyclase domain-containing protein [Acidimicrobiia bacterium]|nr:adenylate/guanylate cyclase domain-containing protein [Acidimicrobiia bacterium]
MVPPSRDDARRAGRQALSGLKGTLAQRIAGLLQRDPELLSEMVELGLVRREWVDDPSAEPVSTAGPMEVAERWFERSVEQRPSLLGKVGLSAIQLLSTSSESVQEAGTPTRLAVAFTDIEGFTAYTAREGDEAASQLLAVHYREVGPVVRGRGGHISKRLGDGLLLTFPSSEAAVLACLEMVALEPAPLRLRAGIHEGEVVVAGDEIVGHVVNVAARVAESAKGGEVLVTGEVRKAVGDLPAVTFGRARGKSFKGVGEKVLVCRAERAG